jgi:imidazole glycerol-phosphate synthase subunit HisH
MIGLINYGMGNLGSVKRTFDILKINNKIIKQPGEVLDCEKIVLPGVGNFKAAMNILDKNGWSDEIKKHVASQKPILGICLGMQLFMETGTESGETKGLGLITGRSISFNSKKIDIRSPHVGWNSIEKINSDSKLLKGIHDKTDFYFVHSYFVETEKDITVAETEHGIKFCSVIESSNIFATQFHPEKSSKSGRLILKNFSSF